MTVAQELKNRNKCRYNLSGVLVTVGKEDTPVAVKNCYWVDRGNKLMIRLVDGREAPATQCHLRSKWPIACCEPERKNEWNS